jgi:WD40 repeat protein
MSFHGFISYSHAADGRLAPAIQQGLHRLAKPWHRRRALWIFRDQTGLAVTPTLWSSIQQALDDSEWFVLLASPEAAQSVWVNREIEHWVASKSPGRILPVVTDGHWQWDPTCGDFTEDSTAVPQALRGAFTEEPLFLDLRWARDDRHVNLRHSRFRDAVAQLAAPMHGMSKDDLEGEDVRQHRRALRFRTGAVAALLVLTVVASLTGLVAVRNERRANGAAAEALRQQQLAAHQQGNAERSAGEALRQQQLARQEQARAREATAETARQEQLAQQQQQLADQASAEASRQQDNARRQQGNARQQQQLADDATRRARQQQRLAEKWAAEAREQQQAARAAKSEARTQQNKATRQERIAVSRRLITQATAMITDEPTTAMMLGAAAQQIQSDAEVRRGVVGMVTSTHYAGTLQRATNVAYAPDGALASLNSDGTLSLSNVANPAKPVKLATLPGVGRNATYSPFSTPAFSRDGRTLAAINSSRKLILWNVADRTRPVRIGELPDFVTSMALSADGRTLATYGTKPFEQIEGGPPPPLGAGDVKLWDVTDPRRPEMVFVFPEYDNHVSDVLLSSDGRTLVINTDDASEIWSLSDRSRPVQVATMDIEVDQPTAFSRERSILLTVGGDFSENPTVTLWDMTNPAEPRKLSTVPCTAAPAFSWDGRFLAVSDDAGTATLWDITDPAEPSRLDSMIGRNGVIDATAFSPDGGTLITAVGETATLWRTENHGAPVAISDLTDHQGHAEAVAFDRTGHTMATANRDGTAAFWDVKNPGRPRPRARAAVSDGWIEFAAFDSGLRTVAAAGQRGLVTLTDVNDPTRPVRLATFQAWTWQPLPPYQYGTMVFDPRGRTLVVVPPRGATTLWDIADPTHPRRLSTVSSKVGHGTVAFSPDGRTLAVTDYPRVALWDVKDRTKPVPMTTIPGPQFGNGTMVFSPNGRILVTGGSTKATAALWNIAERARPRRLALLAGHVDQVHAAAFSPDGRTLATASDQAAMLWDVAEPANPIRIATLKGNTVNRGVAFSPDGHTLVRGATLWDHSQLNKLRADPRRVACAITGRGLTAEEWRNYIPEVPYRATCAKS